MPLIISRNDITQLSTDAIVNAANTQLQMGGGVCGAIFRAAGPAKLQDACDKLAPIKTGEAVITDGFDSKAKYIIHTAGPIYSAGDINQEKLLYACYHNSLTLAAKKKLTSIAFPLISSGIYGYPPDKALSTAIKAIHDFLGAYDGDITVYMIVYNDNAFVTAQKLYDNVESFIDEHLIVDDIKERRSKMLNRPKCALKGKSLEETCCYETASSIDDMLDNMEDSFNKLLFKHIRDKNMTNSDIYKNANIDRRLFSKRISHENYTPSKNTILALSISLRLNINETKALLESAGYALSHSSKADLIIEYYITHQDYKNYNIYDLNFLLFKYDQEQLGQI